MRNFAMALMLATTTVSLSPAAIGAPIIAGSSEFQGSATHGNAPTPFAPADEPAAILMSAGFEDFGFGAEMASPIEIVATAGFEGTGFFLTDNPSLPIITSGGVVDTLIEGTWPGFTVFATIPEPSSLPLLAACIAGLALICGRMHPTKLGGTVGAAATPRSRRRCAR